MLSTILPSRPSVYSSHEEVQTASPVMPRTPEALAAEPCGDAWQPHRLLTCETSPAPAWSWVASRAQHIPQCVLASVGAFSLLSSRAILPGSQYANDRASGTTCSLLRPLCPH